MKTPDFGQLSDMLKSAVGKAGESLGKAGGGTVQGLQAIKDKLGGAAESLAKEAEIGPQLHEQALGALARMQEWDSSLKGEIEKAYGYAIFPFVGRASAVLGVTYGKGEVFEHNRVIGYAGTVQVTVGVQLGGETFHEIVIFDDKGGLDRFKSGGISFAANASIALVKGAAAAGRNPYGLRIFLYNEGGEMLEADIGGQTFKFVPAGLGRLRKGPEQQKGSEQGQGQQGEQASDQG